MGQVDLANGWKKDQGICQLINVALLHGSSVGLID